jgi:hypothetical protein
MYFVDSENNHQLFTGPIRDLCVALQPDWLHIIAVLEDALWNDFTPVPV